MPAALGPSAEQSMFDQAIAIGDPLGGPDLASLGSQPALLEVMSTDTLQAIETQPNPLDAVAKAAPATPAPTTPSPSTHAMGGTAVVTKPATTIMAFLFGEPSEEGEFNYPLWFLILSGLLLSLVLFVIGYSFFRSF